MINWWKSKCLTVLAESFQDKMHYTRHFGEVQCNPPYYFWHLCRRIFKSNGGCFPFLLTRKFFKTPIDRRMGPCSTAVKKIGIVFGHRCQYIKKVRFREWKIKDRLWEEKLHRSRHKKVQFQFNFVNFKFHLFLQTSWIFISFFFRILKFSIWSRSDPDHRSWPTKGR